MSCRSSMVSSKGEEDQERILYLSLNLRIIPAFKPIGKCSVESMLLIFSGLKFTSFNSI